MIINAESRRKPGKIRAIADAILPQLRLYLLLARTRKTWIMARICGFADIEQSSRSVVMKRAKFYLISLSKVVPFGSVKDDRLLSATHICASCAVRFLAIHKCSIPSHIDLDVAPFFPSPSLMGGGRVISYFPSAIPPHRSHVRPAFEG